ncbi:MAG: amino acid adenylation domain-containing protein [bacterium]|nr:amino acid adenylation domain-containing protein [bacterium]
MSRGRGGTDHPLNGELTSYLSRLANNIDPNDRAKVADRLRTRLSHHPRSLARAQTIAASIKGLQAAEQDTVLSLLRNRKPSKPMEQMAEEVGGLDLSERNRVLDALHKRTRAHRNLEPGQSGHPLSPAQQQLWFLDQLHPGSSFYNVASTHRLRGPLDVSTYINAVLAVIDRHESLRTRYESTGGVPAQLIDPPGEALFQRVDLSALAADDRETELSLLIDFEATRPFDLTKGPICRNSLIQMAEDDWVHIQVTHHIATDNWSYDIIHDEIAEQYRAGVDGRAVLRDPPPIQYRDYALRKRREADDGTFDRQLDFWETELAQPLPIVEFQPDFPRPAVQTNAGGKTGFTIDNGAAALLGELAERLAVTPFTVSFAIFNAFVHRQTGAEDIVVGVPTVGRHKLDEEPVVGYFINSAAIRTTVAGDQTLEELVRSVQAAMLDIYANLEVPFDHVVRRIKPERDPSRSPVFQMLFQHFDGHPNDGLKLPGIDVTYIDEEDYATSKHDFEIDIHTIGGVIEGDIGYNADLYTKETAEQIATNYRIFINEILANPAQPVGDIPMMTSTERDRILNNFAGGLVTHGSGTPFELINRRAVEQPDDAAVVHNDESVSYRELMDRVGYIQNQFSAAGLEPGARVALLVERNSDAIAAMVASLAGGHPYIPIDPQLPRDRITWMLEDAAPHLLVTSRPGVSADFDGPIVQLSSLPTATPVPGFTVEPHQVHPDDPAYIIYTSGTSGRPKGTVISHGALSALMHSSAEVYGLTRDERLLQFHSFSFDASVEEIFVPLGTGATLVLRTDDMLGSARRLLRAIDDKHVTVAFFPTAFWHEIATEMIAAELPTPDCLRLVAIGGEAAAPELVAQWRSLYDGALELFNGYGPTEVTVDCVVANLSQISQPGFRSVTIGRPMPTVRALVLDARQQPVPIGVPGELYLGGPQVGNGYLNRPELTLERFVEDPVTGEGTVYRTGDRVAWQPDGNLEFLGRLDRQVKINGHRIEPAEVEAAFLACAAVSQIAVIPEEKNGQLQLAAHAVVTDSNTSAQELVRIIAAQLPAYMVPARVELSVELPRGAGGKVDLRSLSDRPQPDMNRSIVARRLAAAPLSFAQRRMWFLDQLSPEQTTYLVSAAIRLEGTLDHHSLQEAFDAVVRRHEVLRTRIVAKAGIPQQIVEPFGRQAITFHDLRRLGTDAAQDRAEEIMATDEERPFILSDEPTLRLSLIQISSREHIVLAVAHHITFDAESFEVLWTEMASAYSAITAGETPELRGLPFQYSDYAAWQRDAYESGAMQDDLDYWAQQLAAPLPTTPLPADRTRPNGPKGNGGSHVVSLDPGVWRRLSRLAQEEGATPFMVLAAGVATLLHRISGSTDVIVGMPVTERESTDTEHLIGMFVNMLPIRLGLDADSSFATVLDDVRDQVFATLQHRRVPFEVLVETADVERDPGRSPLFQVACAISAADGHPEFADLRATHLHEGGSDIENSKYELTIYGLPDAAGDEMEISFEYRNDLYSPETINRLGDVLRNLFEAAAEAPNTPIGHLDTIDPLTKQWLENTLNATTRPYPARRTIPDVFREIVARHGAKTAIRDETRSLTYTQLAAEAESLAATMRSHGVRTGDSVGLRLDRSLELVTAMLATLKLGACYVPLDPSYPPERIAFMEQNARIRATVAHRGGRFVVAEVDCTEPAFIAPVPAYVMYTSGSTGRPKGVVIPHRAILRLVKNTTYVALGPQDVVAHASNASFDAATFEIWGALLNGATIAILDRDTATSPSGLAAALPRLGVTTMFVTTALFNAIARERPGAFASVTNLMFGGEAVDAAAVRRVLMARPPSKLIHVYGPTESTTFASWHLIESVGEDARSVPIGLPIANTTLHILDANMDVVPVGVEGELYIGGDGLADGYLGDAALTASRFVPDPIAGFGRLYRTGDIARRDRFGDIEFVGRADRQVKLRGFRIEPGEIESHLRNDPDVAEALVRVWDRPGDTRLIGYVVPAVPDLAASTVKDRLHRLLPGHMVPAHIEMISAVPRNPNGKIDLDELPLPKLNQQASFDLPVDPRTKRIAAIWERVLGVERVGLSDSFFDLGGHSLLAVELMAAVEHELNVRVPLSLLFDAPTLAQFSGRVTARTPARTLPQLVVPIRSGSDGNPLFCIHPGGGNVFVYEPMARHLHEGQRVLGIEASGVDGIGEPHRSIEEMAAEYVEIMKRVQPAGPYQLAGYSLGGLIAYETAQQLRSRGEEVSMLALLDTYFPRDAGWWSELAGSITKSRGRGLAGASEALYDVWLSVREALGRMRHGIKWNWLRAWRRPIPPVLAGKRLTHIGLAAYRQYVPAPYDGAILFFRATGADGKAKDRPDLTWREVADVERIDVCGEHTGSGSIVEDPYVGAIATELSKRLQGTL